MSVKVAINGFGRIGRLAFRQMFGVYCLLLVCLAVPTYMIDRYMHRRLRRL